MTILTFLLFLGLLNRFLWMQALFPLHEGDVLIFKTSVSFVDHLQEFLSAVLTCTPLIIPPFHVLKENPLYLVNFLKVSLFIIPPSLTLYIYVFFLRCKYIYVCILFLSNDK